MEFEIENGILKKYHGAESDTEVTVPDGIDIIGHDSFYNCRETNIEARAFFECTINSLSYRRRRYKNIRTVAEKLLTKKEIRRISNFIKYADEKNQKEISDFLTEYKDKL